AKEGAGGDGTSGASPLIILGYGRTSILRSKGDDNHAAAQGRRQINTRNRPTAMMTASSKPASGIKITNAPSTNRKRSIASAAIASATIAKPNGPTLAT